LGMLPSSYVLKRFVHLRFIKFLLSDYDESKSR
jgi:hypothetical protein